MDQNAKSENSEFTRLEARVTELLELCSSMKKNQAELLRENDKLKTERDKLLSRTTMVRERVRSMIEEIKTLESRV